VAAVEAGRGFRAGAELRGVHGRAALKIDSVEACPALHSRRRDLAQGI